MEKFVWKMNAENAYSALSIGDKIADDNGNTLKVTGIVDVVVKEGFVIITGYGVVVEY